MPVPAQYQVAPMPFMQHQKDLNCGYYCERSLLDHWYKKLYGEKYHHLHLVKTTAYSYDPKADSHLDKVAAEIAREDKPADPAEWYYLLNRVGPVIVSGHLGGADWGTWRLGPKKWKAGLGHYMLIVGVDTTGSGKLLYKDPLQGDGIQTGDFTHIDKRLDEKVDYVEGPKAATRIFQALKTDEPGEPGPVGRTVNRIKKAFPGAPPPRG